MWCTSASARRSEPARLLLAAALVVWPAGSAWHGASARCAGEAGPGEVIDRLVAVVGSQTITLSDVRGAAELGLLDLPPGETSEAALVRAAVERALVQLEVERYGGNLPGEPAVTRRIVEITSRLGPEQAAVVMARAGLDEARLRALVRESLAAERYLADRFGAVGQATDDEVQRYYVEHPERFTRDAEVRPFVEVEAEARAALAAERRAEVVAGWLAGLRLRTPVTVLYPPELAGSANRQDP
jgi:hypothetical protein